MNKLASIVQQLQQERARIDAALQALTGGSSNRRGTVHTGGGRMYSVAKLPKNLLEEGH